MDAAKVVGPDEQIQSVVHRHWINVVPVMASLLMISVVALIGFYFLGRYGDGLQAPHAMLLVGLALLAMLVLGVVLAYVSWTIYRQCCLVITNKNLYQVTQNSLFSRKMSQFSLERLQDVSAAQNGVLANLLDFGDVTIETAGEEENFVFRQAADPRALAGRIMNYHQQVVRGNTPTATEA